MGVFHIRPKWYFCPGDTAALDSEGSGSDRYHHVADGGSETEISAEMKSPSGSLKKDLIKASNPPPILGYIQDVGPLKVSASKSEYFTFVVQQKDNSVKVVHFSPKKHKMVVEQKAEKCSPCKVSKYAINRNKKKQKKHHLGS